MINDRQDQLVAMEHWWPPIISKVMHDIEAATDLGVGWQLERHDEAVVLLFQPAVHSGFFGVPLSTGPRRTRHLLLPELRFTTQGLGSYFLVEFDSENADDIGLTVAGLVERIQDSVIDELRGAWPRCVLPLPPARTSPRRPIRAERPTTPSHQQFAPTLQPGRATPDGEGPDLRVRAAHGRIDKGRERGL